HSLSIDGKKLHKSKNFLKAWVSSHQHVFLFSVSSLIILIILWKVFKKPRELTVNCWFCNVNSTVPAGNANCWDCPHCDQYNGFDSEGNYNKPIPAQHYSDFNQGVYAQNPAVTVDDKKFKNILCDQCNQNQQLKVQQLAMFVPYNMKNYDFEIEDFAAHLDSLYQLCLGCELQTQRKLHEVDDWVQKNLLGRKLLQIRSLTSKQPVPLLVHILRWFVLLSTIAILIIDIGTFQAKSEEKTIIFRNQTSLLLSTVVIFVGMLSILLAGRLRLRHIDVISTMYWMFSILTHLDKFLDICLNVFPWKHELENYMNSKAFESNVTVVQQRLIVRIPVDVIGCMLAFRFVLKSVFRKKIKKHRKKDFKPIFLNISRNSSFSSLPRSEVEFAVVPPDILQKNDQTPQDIVSKLRAGAGDHPLNTSLGSLSIGGADPMKKGSEPVNPVVKERRPLISPAKFTVGDGVRKRKCVTADIETPVSVSVASSRASSVNGSVHSTNTNGDYKRKSTVTKSTGSAGSPKNNSQVRNSPSPILYIAFGVSIGVNVTIIAVALWFLLGLHQKT
ncbi:uncharacterized protein LOC117109377, partial [Anneissia japonica]|uniref:uncharacterized protein LOC117109377 n=1 Tax=Anneissia japonica TaxID=1529436 RepID=UPI00142587E1